MMSIENILLSIKKEDLDHMIKNGSKLGQCYYAKRCGLSVYRIGRVFKHYDIKIDRWVLNRRKSVRLPGSR